jgi:hypothetical protein
MFEIRREEDNELCGFVRKSEDRWESLTVFSGLLGVHSSKADAVDDVLRLGLASLAERWLYRAAGSDSWQTVCIVEASPREVTIALDYYSFPGVPTATMATNVVSETRCLRLNDD